MSEPNPRDLETAEQGNLARRLREQIAPVLAEERRAVEKHVFGLLRDPNRTLSGEEAVQCWIRVFEAARLDERLEERGRRGDRAARRAHGTQPNP